MLNPDELNQLSVPGQKLIPGRFALTWFGDNNIGHLNVQGAWEDNAVGTQYPVAIKPTYIHARMGAQKSCFTIFGLRQEPLRDMVPDAILSRFVLRRKAIPSIQRDLKMLGVTHTTVFPEAEYLAKEVTEIGLYSPTPEARASGDFLAAVPVDHASKEAQRESGSKPTAEPEAI